MNKTIIKGDKVIWMITLFFAITSLLVVYSSTETLAFQNKTTTERLLLKQAIVMLCGIGLLYFAHTLKYVYYSRISQFLMILAGAFLLMTFFVAPEINNAQRSLRFTLPIVGQISFQPSDLAKLAMMIFIARFLSKNNTQKMGFKEMFLKIGLPLFIITLLIIRSNFSTAFLLFGVSIVFLFIGKVKIKHLSYLILIAVAGLGMIILIGLIKPEVFPRAKTWVNRVSAFSMSSEKEEPNVQIVHSEIAIAQGGLFGKMPGKSTQRIFLPLAFSDYVYAIIIEEYGLVGGFTVLLLFTALLFRSIKIARRCQMKFGGFLVVGISLMLVCQALFNMLVAVNLAPVTGQPLPFLSMGGTSFWFSCISIGIILSVSRSLELDYKQQYSEDLLANGSE
ncbi:MAG TPA: FtsW/RodA/SpoVE family cell cycle protein [Bacteroidales bacterium]|jgi:cell division protein FtsW|nr:FtsW/RodA/SpoVE family cell cycle protein [Bacteroidales bacterium]NLH33575.1 FtsW/RodA/SpoVE family cell cycle protein [Lentimicrobium sp.]OQC36588.1 MAG: Lipid II flippase FtsW [Bacteroidetes bacterium ADurb.Bin041]MBP7874546.1 FtsW/RodA/SpoVE family cell cycle protein [Bacteroidales bacterium]MCZ2282666.1 FtsW/RodA/SpoVE family cell cycle protein [Bacteroidales bacterium]